MSYILALGVVTPFCTQKPGIFSLFPLLGFHLPRHYADTAATQSSCSNQLLLYNLICLVHWHLNSLEPCRLTFIQVLFQLLLTLRLSLFFPSVTGNYSIFLPVSSFSFQLCHVLTVFQIPSPHREQRNSKTQSSSNQHQTPSLFVPFNSEWKFTIQETDLTAHRGRVSTQHQLLKTLACTSPMFSSETSLIFEAVSVQSQINYNTELFQNTRKGLASAWIQSLQFLRRVLRRQHLPVLRIGEIQNKSLMSQLVSLYLVDLRGLFNLKNWNIKLEKYLLRDLSFRSNKRSPLLAATSIFLHISQPSGEPAWHHVLQNQSKESQIQLRQLKSSLNTSFLHVRSLCLVVQWKLRLWYLQEVLRFVC